MELLNFGNHTSHFIVHDDDASKETILHAIDMHEIFCMKDGAAKMPRRTREQADNNFEEARAFKNLFAAQSHNFHELHFVFTCALLHHLSSSQNNRQGSLRLRLSRRPQIIAPLLYFSKLCNILVFYKETSQHFQFPLSRSFKIPRLISIGFKFDVIDISYMHRRRERQRKFKSQ